MHILKPAAIARSGLFAAAAAAYLSFTPVHAGEVILGTGQVHTVTGKNEVLKGTFSGVVVAADGAHVVLSQATIDCSSAPWPRVGIHLPGGRSGVHVNGGTVQNCNSGVLLGDPFVWGAPAGSRNHINGVTVRSAVVTGGTHFDGDAITINNGVNNRVNGSVVEGFHPMGIRVFRGSSNDIVGNTVQDTQAPSDPYNAALLLQEAIGNSVRDNLVTDNANRGIWAQFNAQRNILTGNTALNNGGVDAADDSSPCANTWRDNVVGTLSEATAGCVQ